MAHELTDEEARVCAAAYEAWPQMIVPDDQEMSDVCDSLDKRGNLNEVREGEGEPDLERDKVVGYVASAEHRAAMQLQASLN
jgi:hypothetical protein